ncbi:TfoX/Sxy family protein [Ruminiclostridium herbifermentans]|uniref:TfoX/Sxy family protein n=1 Tax=Ruminiclostridium herbifermentans TaxID=2488810 RepID=A0A4V6EP72_9FIRM|nr:TfoX/Sxy family protein [Ruminiclostridium herbifermentans]QNU66066.1 TfoX/Sxy family protein [Ruminiclostridium herbifermentans]
MSQLSKLPNIGKILEQQLKEVGIDTIEKLRETGSKQCWLKLREIDATACINRLYALEGAIQGIRWHYLSDEIKSQLKDFYTMNTSLK